MSRLYQHFCGCFHHFATAITPEQTLSLWQDIESHYREPHRHYHTLDHLKRMFAEFDLIAARLASPNLVAFAIFYHDIIYDPTRSDNEAKSAELMQSSLSDYLTKAQLDRIKALILMTADHNLTAPDDLDAAYFLDLDLSILAAPWAEYQQYAKAVRLEYGHVAEADYRKGRTAVLQSLLAHPKLYLTQYFYDVLNQRAYLNIQSEIKTLAVG